MSQAPFKTAPPKATGMPKGVPTVNMVHPMHPVVDKLLVPAGWFIAGVCFARIFWPSVKHVAFKE